MVVGCSYGSVSRTYVASSAYSCLKLEFHGPKVTSDAGLLACRELDEACDRTAFAGKVLSDSRTGKSTQHGLTALLQQSTCSRLARCEDTNDAERLSVDPTMRLVAGERAYEHHAASTSHVSRFKTNRGTSTLQ